MNNSITALLGGCTQSSYDNFIERSKKIFSRRTTSSIDKLLSPLLTSLFNTLQILSLHEKSVILLKGRSLFPTISRNVTWKISSSFLFGKIFLAFTSAIAADVIGKDKANFLMKVDIVLDAMIPIANIVMAVATANIFFIAAYIFQTSLLYLGSNNVLTNDMRNICEYSGWALGLTSLLLMDAPAKINYLKL